MSANSSSNVVSMERYLNRPSNSATQSANVIGQLTLSPSWEKPVRDRMQNLLGLKAGWDSANAQPVDGETARYAIGLLYYVWPFDGQAPFIAPTCYGGIQFEWQVAGQDLEIEVVRPHQIKVLLVGGDLNEEQVFECRHDLSMLLQAVDKLRLSQQRNLNETVAA
jgi:hypothetical protein